jgi:hypothetical protein
MEIKITKEDVLRMRRAAERRANIELGIRPPATKVHKNKKHYTRKDKHKSQTP